MSKCCGKHQKKGKFCKGCPHCEDAGAKGGKKHKKKHKKKG
jgi:hypothetical protein